MPRAGTGTCTAPAGQPVVAGTVISDVVFNTLVTDIYTILTDSLSRTGSGSMSVPLGNPDGLVGSPGIIFTNEAGSGFYRAGANDIRMSIAGVDRASWTTAGFYAAIAELAGLTVTGTLDATTIDHGGTIDIGTTNATTITIGRSGQTVNMPGTVIGGLAWSRVVATSDTTNSSDATASDIAGLTFACASGNKYLVRAVLFCYGAVPGTGFGVAAKSTGAPTTSTQFFVHRHWGQTLGYLNSTYSAFTDTPVAFTDGVFSTTAANPQLDDWDAYFVTTGNGTFQLNLLSEVNTNAVTVKAGSYLEWAEFT